jgi:hypothetical protein
MLQKIFVRPFLRGQRGVVRWERCIYALSLPTYFVNKITIFLPSIANQEFSSEGTTDNSPAF